MGNDGKIIGVELALDQEYIKASVEKIVQAGIIQALGNPADLVQKAISTVLGSKVDDDGKATNSSYHCMPYLNWVAKTVVEKTVRDAMTEMVKSREEELRTEILRQLNSRTFKETIIGAFLTGILDGAKTGWKMPVSVTFEEAKRNY